MPKPLRADILAARADTASPLQTEYSQPHAAFAFSYTRH
jgi:hypothetical protein